MTENKKALLAYLAVCLFWGSTYLAIRIGVRDFPASLFASFRFIIAGSILMFYVKWKGYDLPKSKQAVKQQAIIGLMMLLGGTGLVCHAEKTLHSSIASLIVSSVPLFIAFLEIIVLKQQKMSVKGVLGLFIGFGGVSILALSGSGKIDLDMTGMLLMLGASLSWSVGSVYSKQVEKQGHIISNIAIQMLSGGLGLLILGALTGEFNGLSPSMDSVFALMYLVVFGSIIGYSCYIYALQVWPAARVGTYAYVNPVVALILGVIILNEPVNLTIVASLVIILSGVVLVQSSKIEKQ